MSTNLTRYPFDLIALKSSASMSPFKLSSLALVILPLGWQNVRGGDYCKTEDYKLKEGIDHIFDTETNRIRYFVPQVKYLFGTSEDYIIYILKLENNKYYIGSTRKLGRALVF
jgi:hypothetical protein